MALALFYYTLLILLVSIFSAAVCLAAYLVTRNASTLCMAGAFLFYFFDVVLVFQDEYVLLSFAGELSYAYMLVRSLFSLLTGTGVFGFLWLAFCEYSYDRRRAVRAVPIAVFVILSLAALFFLPSGPVQRFCYWSMRQAFMLFALLQGIVRYLRTDDQVLRNRFWRHRGTASATLLLAVLIVVTDAFALYGEINPDTAVGLLGLSQERSFPENAMMLVIAASSVAAAWRSLSLRFNTPPEGESLETLGRFQDNLLIYASRYGLSEREREILSSVLQGMDNQNIASEKHLSPSTVKVHVHNILKKTGQPDRKALTRDFWKTS